jgi:hypothetical protein
MAGTLLVANRATRAQIIVEAIAFSRTELDDRAFRAGAITAIALEAIATG